MKRYFSILALSILFGITSKAESPVDVAKSVAREAYGQLETVSYNGNRLQIPYA